jgi:phage gp29-like protein
MLIDQHGRPLKASELKKEFAAPTPFGARVVTSRDATFGLDPARLARVLRRAQEGDAGAYLELAEEMEEKYLHYAAQLATRKRAVSGIAAQIIPASDLRRDRQIAKFVEQVLPLVQEAAFDILDSLGKGFSATEILWNTEGANWFPERLEVRDPRWFQFAKADGRTLRLKDDQHPDGLPLPAGKFILHQSTAKTGLPIRGGLARAASWAFLFQNFALRDWVTFIETFGKPLRLGRYEGNVATPADIDKLMEAVQSLGTDAAAILPKSMLIEFPEVQGARGDNQLWRLLLEYLDRQVSKLVLGQTLTADTGESGGGSYALGGVHNEVRMDILADDALRFSETINRDLIRPLVDLNFAGVTGYPRYALRVEEAEDMTALIGIVEKAVGMGQPISMKWFSEKFGIPLAQAGEEILERQGSEDRVQRTEDRVQRTEDRGRRTEGLRRAAPDEGEPTLLEANLARLETETAPLMAGWLAQIEAMLEAADSLEEFREMLLAAYPKLDTADMTKTLTAAMTAMALAGKDQVSGDRNQESDDSGIRGQESGIR